MVWFRIRVFSYHPNSFLDFILLAFQEDPLIIIGISNVRQMVLQKSQE